MVGKGPGQKNWQGPHWWQLHQLYPSIETEALGKSLWQVEKWELITQKKGQDIVDVKEKKN